MLALDGYGGSQESLFLKSVAIGRLLRATVDGPTAMHLCAELIELRKLSEKPLYEVGRDYYIARYEVS